MATTLCIYAHAVLRNGPPRPNRETHAANIAPATRAPMISIQDAIEIEMNRILDALPGPGESVARTFDTKEAALAELFATLTREECLKLHVSLVNGDITSLARLSTERRGRVMSALNKLTQRAAR